MSPTPEDHSWLPAARGPQEARPQLLLPQLLLLLISCSEPTPQDLPARDPSRPDSTEWTQIKARIRSTFPSVREVSTEELARELASATTAEERPVLIDARPTNEYVVSHLEGAICMGPGVLDTIPKDRSIVVYCSVGYRSAELARRLDRLGYMDVRNLEGSIFEWANEGRPLYSGDRRVQKVHPYDSEWGRLLAPAHH